MYHWVTLLCPWNTVSQLCFNKIYVLRKNITVWFLSPAWVVINTPMAKHRREEIFFILELWNQCQGIAKSMGLSGASQVARW